MSDNYLSRNLHVCRAYGIAAAAKSGLVRLKGLANPPKWLIKKFEEIEKRAQPLPSVLAQHRDELKVMHQLEVELFGDKYDA